jgi:NitT/TauT family transport system permease protein
MHVVSDTLEAPALPGAARARRGPSLAARIWAATWPKLFAIGIAIGIWQVVVWSGWKSETILPSPFTVFETFWDERAALWDATVTTMARAIQGYLIALIIGVALGLAVSRSRILRAGIGSMITGLQTMPSIAWFPFAILMFQLSEAAILFVVVLGATPSIANGIITGVDHIEPVLLRAGRVLGARGFTLIRSVVLPAALPSFVGGLKQGWAFAWRSLLAGELIVLLGKESLGQQLQNTRQLADYSSMYAVMLMILIVGIVVDSCVFGTLDRWVRRRYGLIDNT